MSLVVGAEPIPLMIDSDGVVRIGSTRVTLDTMVAAFHDGATTAEILQQYPSLQLADVYAVIGYYLRHQREVEVYLQERQQHSAQWLMISAGNRWRLYGVVAGGVVMERVCHMQRETGRWGD